MHSLVSYQGLWPLFILAFIVAAAVFRSWRTGLLMFVVWITFEDCIRKFNGNNMAIFFAKDAILLMTYISYLVSRQREKDTSLRFDNPLIGPLWVWVLVGLVQCFNPLLYHPGLPFLGIRMWFFYIPLLYLGYEFLRTEAGLRRMLMFLISLSGIAAVIGLLQYALGPQFLNPEGLNVPHLRLIGARAGMDETFFRPTSLFTNPSRFGKLLFVYLWISLGAISYLTQMRRESTNKLGVFWVWIVLVMIAGNILINGWRALLVVSAITVPIFVIFAFRRAGGWSGLDPFQRTLMRAGMLAAIIGAVLIAANWRPAMWQVLTKFYQTTLLPGSPEWAVPDRLNRYLISNRGSLWGALQRSGFTGHGTGTASLGQHYLFDIDPVAEAEKYGAINTKYYENVPVEGGFSSVVWEWGAIGLAVWFWWTIALIVHQVRAVRILKGTRFYSLGLGILLWSFSYLFPLTFMGVQIFQDYIANAYFWMSVGILFRLRDFATDEWLETRDRIKVESA